MNDPKGLDNDDKVISKATELCVTMDVDYLTALAIAEAEEGSE